MRFDGETPGEPLGFISEHGILHSSLFEKVKEFEADGSLELTCPAQVGGAGRAGERGHRERDIYVYFCFVRSLFSASFFVVWCFCSFLFLGFPIGVFFWGGWGVLGSNIFYILSTL